MPRIKTKHEEAYDDVDEGQEDMEEELEQEEERRSRGRPRKLPPPPQLPPMPTPKRKLPAPPRQQQPPQLRYTGFVQQAAEGIMDSETNEVLATDMWTALANIIERLERIETSLGSMLEG